MKHYDAFISYHHESDGELAEQLERSLKRFAKPWNRRRALEVFRDRSSLGSSGHLDAAISDALRQADHLVLIVSDATKEAYWMSREIELFRTSHPVGDVISRVHLVVASGTIGWDRSENRFTADSVVPDVLHDAFASEPLWIDLRSPSGTITDPRSERFRDAVASLASPMHGRPKEDMIGEDIVQFKRTRRVRRWAVGALAALTVLSAGTTVAAMTFQSESVQQRRLRDEADRQREEADRQRELTDENRAEAERQRQLADDARTAAEAAQATAEVAAADERAAREQLDVVNAELARTNAVLAERNEELDRVNAELEETNQQIRDTNEDLNESNELLEQAKLDLETQNEQLEEARARLAELNAELDCALDLLDAQRDGLVDFLTGDGIGQRLDAISDAGATVVFGRSTSDAVDRAVDDLRAHIAERAAAATKAQLDEQMKFPVSCEQVAIGDLLVEAPVLADG